MSERSDRLRLALKRAKVTQRQAVERWGWNPNTLKSNLNGMADFGYKTALRYGARLKVRAEWLYDGVEPMAEPPAPRFRFPVIEMPVISWVSAGTMTDITAIDPSDEIDRISVSGLPPANYFATEVRGDSMDRVAPNGARLIVNADELIPNPGGYFLFSLRGETTFKRFYDDPIRLEPFSTNPSNRPIFPREDQELIVIGRAVRSLFDLK